MHIRSFPLLPFVVELDASGSVIKMMPSRVHGALFVYGHSCWLDLSRFWKLLG